MKKMVAAILLTVVLSLSACAPAFRNEVVKQAKAKGWTEEQ